jgi:hypothetical protein
MRRLYRDTPAAVSHCRHEAEKLDGIAKSPKAADQQPPRSERYVPKGCRGAIAFLPGALELAEQHEAFPAPERMTLRRSARGKRLLEPIERLRDPALLKILLAERLAAHGAVECRHCRCKARWGPTKRACCSLERQRKALTVETGSSAPFGGRGVGIAAQRVRSTRHVKSSQSSMSSCGLMRCRITGEGLDEHGDRGVRVLERDSP